jgi:effector-binding domain-containing protein
MMNPCEIKELPARPTLSIRFRAAEQELPGHFGRVYGAISQYLRELGEQHVGAAFAAYHTMDMQNLDVEAGFPVSRPLPDRGDIRAGKIPGGMVAICHYTGPYDKVGTAYEDLTQFVKEKGYTPAGVCYEWYLNGPGVPPQDLKTDIVFPVTFVGETAGV